MKIFANGIGAKMSRRSISLLAGLYFLAALAFGVFRVLSNPFYAGISATSAGQAIAGALLLLALAGLPALLVWAFYRFNPRYALWPILSWALLGIAFAFLIGVGTRLERDVQVSTLAKNLALSDAKLSCLDTQHASKFRSEVGITDREISIYCGCISEAIAAAVTPDELTYIVTSGKTPERSQEQAVQLGRPCSHLLRGKPSR
jgi:hypothetical protein